MLTDEIISRSYLFKSLDPEGREKLLRGSSTVTFLTGDVLIREGEAGDSFFLLKSGEVQVTTMKGSEEVVLARLTPGAFFGEVAVITDEPRTATVTAATDGEVVRFGRDQVKEILRTYPRVAALLKTIMARRTEATIKTIQDRS